MLLFSFDSQNSVINFIGLSSTLFVCQFHCILLFRQHLEFDRLLKKYREMKRAFILTFLLVSAEMSAQDLIIKSDGEEIKAKVLSVEEHKVSYKKWTNQNGPTYSLNTDNIFMIKYENGEKDVFTAKPDGKKTSTYSDVAMGYIEKKPAADNAALINKYNPKVEFNLKQKSSKAGDSFPVMGVEPSSVLSNEDIEINFVRTLPRTEYYFRVLRYYIEIKNKTNNIIYIDKGNSFKSINNISTPFYDTKQISVTSGGASGASLGLGSIAGALGVGGVVGSIAGGMSVGGGTSSSVSTSYIQQRILAIAPHSSAYISECIWDNYKTNKWKQISDAEFFLARLNEGERLNKGQCIEYTADNSPCKYRYYIVYSTSPDFKTYSSVNANLYIKYVIGASVGISYGSIKSLNKSYNKVIPNFVSVPSMIVGSDGNYSAITQ